jgi:hypothetical protein
MVVNQTNLKLNNNRCISDKEAATETQIYFT